MAGTLPQGCLQMFKNTVSSSSCYCRFLALCYFEIPWPPLPRRSLLRPSLSCESDCLRNLMAFRKHLNIVRLSSVPKVQELWLQPWNKTTSLRLRVYPVIERPPGKGLHPQCCAVPHPKPNLWHLAEFFCHNQFQSHRLRISQVEDPWDLIERFLAYKLSLK